MAYWRALQACALVLLGVSIVRDNTRSLFAPAPVHAAPQYGAQYAAPATHYVYSMPAAPMYTEAPMYAMPSNPYVQYVEVAQPAPAPKGSSALVCATGGAVGAVLAALAVSGRRSPAAARRASAPAMVDIPRIELPSSVTDVLKDLNLKNPNNMSSAEYNSYSGAAILGTLVVFLIPGSLIFDVKGAIFDFIFSALLGGGLMAFLALNPSTAEPAGKAGDSLLNAVDKLGEKLK